MRNRPYIGPGMGIALFVSVVSAHARQPETPKQPEGPSAKSPMSEQDFMTLVRNESHQVDLRRALIDEELAAIKRDKLKDGDWAKEWAGTYYTGDGLGMNVTIAVAPESGITYTWRGCTGLYDANDGEIVSTFPGGLTTKLAIDEALSHWGYMSSTLYFVRWGERRFLVPESQMLKLVINYNKGSYSRQKMYGIPEKFDAQVRRRAWDAPPTAGKPDLPAKYAALILENPFNVTITKISARSVSEVGKTANLSEWAVELDAGRKQGMFVGLEVDYPAETMHGTIIFEHVDETTSSGTLWTFDNPERQRHPPAVGTVLRFLGTQLDDKPKQPGLEVKTK